MQKDPYITCFEDEYGSIQTREQPCWTDAHMLYEFIPLISEHNETQQSVLALKNQWLTKNCWTQIVTSFLVMPVVDLQFWIEGYTFVMCHQVI